MRKIIKYLSITIKVELWEYIAYVSVLLYAIYKSYQ